MCRKYHLKGGDKDKFYHVLLPALGDPLAHLITESTAGAEMTPKLNLSEPRREQEVKETSPTRVQMEPLILAEMLWFPSFLSFCSFCLLLPIAHVASGPLGSTDWFSNIRAFTRLPWLGRRGQRGVADGPQDLLAFPLSRRKRLGATTFRSTIHVQNKVLKGWTTDTRYNTDGPL